MKLGTNSGCKASKNRCFFSKQPWTQTEWFTLRWFKLAMEHGPFIDDLPIKYDDCPWLSLDVLNNQRVSTIHYSQLGICRTPRWKTKEKKHATFSIARWCSYHPFQHLPLRDFLIQEPPYFHPFPKVHGFSHPKHGFSHPKPLFPKVQSQWFLGLGFKTAVISGGFLPVAREAKWRRGEGWWSFTRNQQKLWS